MSKVKWHLTTGRESVEARQRAVRIMFGDGVTRENILPWSWHEEEVRTRHRLNIESVGNYVIVAYTLGETVESKQCQKY